MGLAATGAELTTDRCFVNQYLDRLLSVDPNRANGPVQEAMRYAVLGPAQRIRPLLAMRVGRLLNGASSTIMQAAAAIELLHCASLVIDDLPCMDNSPVRRNQPAVHIRFGEATAVLAAFGLVALAARSVLECDSGRFRLGPMVEFQLQLLRSLDCAGLIAGQALDLQLAHCASLRTCAGVTELKTAPLFQLAVRAGSLDVDLDDEERVALDCFGREFGLAFQLTDDLQDGDEIDRSLLDEKLTLLRAVLRSLGSERGQVEPLLDYLDARAVARH